MGQTGLNDPSLPIVSNHGIQFTPPPTTPPSPLVQAQPQDKIHMEELEDVQDTWEEQTYGVQKAWRSQAMEDQRYQGKVRKERLRQVVQAWKGFYDQKHRQRRGLERQEEEACSWTTRMARELRELIEEREEEDARRLITNRLRF